MTFSAIYTERIALYYESCDDWWSVLKNDLTHVHVADQLLPEGNELFDKVLTELRRR